MVQGASGMVATLKSILPKGKPILPGTRRNPGPIHLAMPKATGSGKPSSPATVTLSSSSRSKRSAGTRPLTPRPDIIRAKMGYLVKGKRAAFHPEDPELEDQAAILMRQVELANQKAAKTAITGREALKQTPSKPPARPTPLRSEA